MLHFLGALMGNPGTENLPSFRACGSGKAAKDCQRCPLTPVYHCVGQRTSYDCLDGAEKVKLLGGTRPTHLFATPILRLLSSPCNPPATAMDGINAKTYKCLQENSDMQGDVDTLKLHHAAIGKHSR